MPIPNIPITIDCEYMYPEFAAAYLLIEQGRAAFIENNTTKAVPKLLAELGRSGLRPQDVDYIIVTHVHLDHAGGSGALMVACPNATLLAHPRAARHLSDPSRLENSARFVYGDAAFDRLYGSVQAVSANRIREMQDGEAIRFGSRNLTFLHTPGHAKHHMCIYDSGSDAVFTGDSFGLAYPALQQNGLFIFPSTSPTDFDPDAALVSIDRIMATGASHAFLTHFGELKDMATAAKQLKIGLEFCKKLLKSAKGGNWTEAELKASFEQKLRAYFLNYLAGLGAMTSDREILDLLRLDIELNASGIAHAASLRYKG